MNCCLVYSEVEVTRRNYNILSAAEQPLVAIVGTTSPTEPLHSGVLRYSGYWLRRPGFSLGTLALSVKSQPEISREQENRVKALHDGAVRSLQKMTIPAALPGIKIPLPHLERKSAGS